MKAIAVNGSPRKSFNTAILLQRALEGAESIGADTELINLYDLNFKGCTSCFLCKRKANTNIDGCAMHDDLTGVLQRISQCDVLLLGSPIYLANITGEMHSFLERLLFPNMSYNAGHSSVFKGKIHSGFIYTMNRPNDVSLMKIPEELKKHLNYEAVFNYYEYRLQILNGISDFMLSTDTYQFDDYSKYEVSMFDEKHKLQVKTEQFPIDCKNAFDMGARLTAKSQSNKG